MYWSFCESVAHIYTLDLPIKKYSPTYRLADVELADMFVDSSHDY